MRRFWSSERRTCFGTRLVEAGVLLGVALLAAFAVARLMPGNPVTLMVEGGFADPAFVRRLQEAAGLDQPWWRQFIGYIADLLRGDLGMSLRYHGASVVSLIGGALPVTLFLVIGALALSVPFGVFFGVVAAARHASWVDGLITAVSVFALSVPPVVMASWLMLTLGIWLGLLPVAGWGKFSQLIMPLLVLSVPLVATIARFSRVLMLEVMTRDFVRMARAKGLPEGAVLWCHALPNVLVVLVTAIGVVVGNALTSAVVVETIFNLPGMGRLGIQAVLARDYPVVSAVALFFIFFQVVISLVTDLLTVMIDPRVRNRPGVS